MELEIIHLLTTTLLGSPEFVTIVGLDALGEVKLFPLLADEGTIEPYVNYRVDEVEDVSKDGARLFSVVLGFAFDSKGYLKVLELKALIESLMVSAGFEYKAPGVIDLVEDTQRVGGTVFFEIIWTPNS